MLLEFSYRHSAISQFSTNLIRSFGDAMQQSAFRVLARFLSASVIPSSVTR